MKTHFLFIIPGRNCEAFVDECLSSVRAQTYPHWQAFVYNDASDDDTQAKISAHTAKDTRIFSFFGRKRNYAAYARWYLIQRAHHPQIGVLLDLDDYLAGPDVLARLLVEYESGASMTYGSYRMHDPNVGEWPQGPYPPGVIGTCTAKEHPWRFAPLRTFRMSLVQGLKDEMFKGPDGNWLDRCTELPLLMPALTYVPEANVRYIDEVLYVYRSNHGNNCRNHSNTAYRNKLENHIRGMI